MQISHAIRERRSVRAFMPDPVPKQLVSDVLDLARWSPSWANTQGWNVYALTGPRLDELRAEMSSRASVAQLPMTDLEMPGRQWPEYLQSRMSFPRRPAEMPESEGASAAQPSIWEFYGAPWLLLLAIDRRLVTTYACFDTGLLVDSICLAAEDRGLGTCIMAMAVRFPELLHRMIPAAADKDFVVGVALGLPDLDALVNRTERERAPLDEIVTWVE